MAERGQGASGRVQSLGSEERLHRALNVDEAQDCQKYQCGHFDEQEDARQPSVGPDVEAGGDGGENHHHQCRLLR